ncbi:Senescence-associated protein osa15 protein, partial [Thalictrum thalictroides]
MVDTGIQADEVVRRETGAMVEAYWSIASALSEVYGIDYTDPEEIELVAATIKDLDAMDDKRTVSLLVDCSGFPHMTR